MPLDLQAIKENSQRLLDAGVVMFSEEIENNVKLVAEVERLRKENADLSQMVLHDTHDEFVAKREIERLQTAIKQMLDLEAENLEGYDSELHKVGREALGLSAEEYFGEDKR